MVALAWDQTAERLYETGVDRGVLYIPTDLGVYSTGVAWNGLVSVTESPSGAEATAQYADNIKYLNLISAEEFSATLEAFTFPPEFNQFDGYSTPEPGVVVGQQPRRAFGLAYRSRLGNDVEADSYGYKIHLVYGCVAAPSEKAYTTINDSPEAITFSWEISTTPVPVTGYSATSLIVIDSSTVLPADLADFEEQIWGGTAVTANLPLPDDVIAMFPGV